MFLTLDVSSTCCGNDDGDESDEQYRYRGTTDTTWDVHGVTLGSRDTSYSLPADFEVEIGDTVHVVYAVYSTGDSFGHDNGYALEVLSFHKNIEIAKRNEAAANAYKCKGDFRLVLEFDSGGKVDRYCPWDGYFESLDYVRRESHIVQPTR